MVLCNLLLQNNISFYTDSNQFQNVESLFFHINKSGQWSLLIKLDIFTQLDTWALLCRHPKRFIRELKSHFHNEKQMLRTKNLWK